MKIIATELITNALFLVSFLFLVFSFSGTMWKKLSIPQFVSIGLSIFFSFLSALYLTPVVYLMVSILLSIAVTMICSKKPFSDVFLYHILAYSFIGLAQMTLLLFLPQTNRSLTSPKIQIIGQVIILFFCIAIYIWIPVKKLFDSHTLTSKIFKGIFITIYAFIVIASIYSKYKAKQSLLLLPLIALFICCLFFCLYQNINQQKKYAVLQAKLEDYSNYQPIFEDLVEHVRTRQHEFDNQLMAIRALPLTFKDYDSLSNALTNNVAQIMQSLQNASLLKLNLKVLAAFLFSKVQQASKKEIHIGIVVENSLLHTTVPEHELLEIAGILIDNAVEAVTQGDSITITLNSHENKIEISTLNKGPKITPKLRAQFFQKGYTTKSANETKLQRGLGLYRLKQLVDSYDGSILLDNAASPEAPLVFIQVIV